MQNKERKFLKLSSAVIVVIIIFGFATFQSKKLVRGPRILIETPLNGKTIENSLTQIKGTAKNISEIKLNGRQIFVDEKGLFEERVLLSYGYNKIVIEARDRFKRTVKKELELVYK